MAQKLHHKIFIWNFWGQTHASVQEIRPNLAGGMTFALLPALPEKQRIFPACYHYRFRCCPKRSGEIHEFCG